MEAESWQTLLNRGIQAVRSGDRALGRDLLLRVVAENERVEPAWLWLSAALDDPADQLTALENVLALNPTNAQALAGKETLLHRLGRAVPAPAKETAPPSNAVMPSADDATVESPSADLFLAEDDPLQCAYCGQLTVEEDERCPHCGRSLLVPGFWRAGGHQYSLLILVGLVVQAAMVQSAAAYLLAFMPNSLAAVPGSEVIAASPMIAAVARGVLWAIILVMLLGDSLAAYKWAALLAAADLGWQALGLGLGWVGRELAAVNGTLGLFIGVWSFSAVIGQAQARRRLLVAVDRGLQSAPLFNERAEHYAKRGMWAMAAVHWQKAVARQPREPSYYKALGLAQTRLGRHAQAVRTLRSGAELAPEDNEFERLIGAIRAATRSS
jgi:tetratricopeptide (TPR) repeat protein